MSSGCGKICCSFFSPRSRSFSRSAWLASISTNAAQASHAARPTGTEAWPKSTLLALKLETRRPKSEMPKSEIRKQKCDDIQKKSEAGKQKRDDVAGA